MITDTDGGHTLMETPTFDYTWIDTNERVNEEKTWIHGNTAYTHYFTNIFLYILFLYI